jgi:hypothetical protein
VHIGKCYSGQVVGIGPPQAGDKNNGENIKLAKRNDPTNDLLLIHYVGV